MQNIKEDAQPSHGGITLTLDNYPKIVQEKEYMQKYKRYPIYLQ